MVSKSCEVTTLTLGATATRRRLRPLWDPGRASWRCRLLSNSTSENVVENIETTVTASDCEMPEWFGCQVDSESIAPSRIGYAVRVLSLSERCRDDHNVRVRLRTRRSRAELLMKSETMNPWIARTRMASGCLRGARQENNGSEMHSQTSQVCPGIQRNWRGSR